MRLRMMLLVLPLAACGDDSMTRQFGLLRDAPPGTTSRAALIPLSMPPTLSMRPTRTGGAPARDTAPAAESANSMGQDALVEAAGPAAPSDIRQLVDENAGSLSFGQGFAQSMMNWTPQPGYTPLTASVKKGWLSGLF